MGVQTTYNFATPVGNPGGIFDLTDYISVSRNNSENDGVLAWGTGVMVDHNKPGKAIKYAGESDTQFEGVVMNTGTSEMDKYGRVSIANKSTVGIMTKGKIWVRVAHDNDSVPAYGDTVSLITAGNEKGKFCTSAYQGLEGDSSFASVGINAKFITGCYEDVAAIELYGNSPAYENLFQAKLAYLKDVDTSGAADGKVLKYNGTKWVAGTDET